MDVFLTTQSYIDIASISVVPRTTGGQVFLTSQLDVKIQVLCNLTDL